VYSFEEGVSVVDTCHKTKEKVVKTVAEIIHSREYEKADLHARLSNIAKGRYKC
jgi:exonuclease VII small subunit